MAALIWTNQVERRDAHAGHYYRQVWSWELVMMSVMLYTRYVVQHR
jgi:hypothetical protein